MTKDKVKTNEKITTLDEDLVLRSDFSSALSTSGMPIVYDYETAKIVAKNFGGRVVPFNTAVAMVHLTNGGFFYVHE